MTGDRLSCTRTNRDQKKGSKGDRFWKRGLKRKIRPFSRDSREFRGFRDSRDSRGERPLCDPSFRSRRRNMLARASSEKQENAGHIILVKMGRHRIFHAVWGHMTSLTKAPAAGLRISSRQSSVPDSHPRRCSDHELETCHHTEEPLAGANGLSFLV